MASGTQAAVPSPQMFMTQVFPQSFPNASMYSAPQSIYQPGQNDYSYSPPMEYYWPSMQQPYNYMMGMPSYSSYISGPTMFPMQGNSNGFVSYEDGNNGIGKDFS